MSGKPTVTLTLAGDEAKLTDAFDKVGSASKQMSDKVDSSSKAMADSGDRFDTLTDSADGAEGKFMGFHDVLDGVKGAFETLADPSASFTDKLIGLGQAGADVAGGMASFLIPAMQGMWTKLTATTAAQWALTTAQTAWNAITEASAVAMKLLNAAFISSPIGWIVLAIAGLVAAFIILWNKSEGFRNFFIGMWNGIKTVVGAVVDWVKGAWEGVVGFFTGLPGRIGSAIGSLAGIVKNVFKGVVNTVVDALNWFLDHTINWLIQRVNDVSGLIGIPAIPKIPHIPRMHTGGVVPGMPGSEVPIMAMAGEHVSTSSQGGATVTFAGDLDSGFARYVMKLVRTGEIRFEGA